MKIKFKIALHKRYFDLGLSTTNYVKYLIAFFGLASGDIRQTLIFAFIYAIFCYLFGMFWIHSGMYEQEQEVSNIFNKFVKEMRKSVKRKI